MQADKNESNRLKEQLVVIVMKKDDFHGRLFMYIEIIIKHGGVQIE